MAEAPPEPTPELFAALREFIRARGSGYLQDSNVTSIGVGHRVRGGRRTDEVAIQFTVGTKAAPEALGELGTEPLPASITVAGVEVLTDVLERSYRPSFRVVGEAAANERKSRVDPVRPGVSIGHPKITCGTVGAVVYDRQDGTPYVLSNWHVLNGPDGEVGDVVVQPGRHDDNRVDRNHVGTLVRSYLGIAGDAALATVTGRGLDASVIELDVAPAELGEPELGDKVVKSGRTTGVTHGVVRRVDTIVKLDYGTAAGVVEVGCFEIGVDPHRKPRGGEISEGGDSGAAWLFKAANGRPAKVLAGLHFAGEGTGDPDEHALACLPRSVFDKLDITLLRPETAPEPTAGYDDDFLGVALPVPELDPSVRGDACLLDGSSRIDYTHFSLALSTPRKFAFWVAWNIDGGGLRKLNRSGIPFVKDPRLPATAQAGDEVYQGNRLDRGHLARRADLLWGTPEEAAKANRDSFFFTNITPQMDDFNQSARSGLWGRLEDALFADVEVDDLRVSVFGGPLFAADDRLYRGVRLPREFWKVIASVQDGALNASAFLLTQNLNQLESLEFAEFRVFQVPITELGSRASLQFPAALVSADTAPDRPESAGQREPLADLSEITWN
ncbi:DNA/RNA non-specific endonuclease [Actinokineospora auranticolor]|uniref:Endonuclease G n=1 Tax=Actinokineospora auranticolor TaxID=155976 RepID=A0A2S6H085_9PSEU|nr:DNA/RNA non-specific endonuclease [Actinokineospora auranticolor]PPK70836.1 endonuclease G [Actinokineospora auranticolor]